MFKVLFLVAILLASASACSGVADLHAVEQVAMLQAYDLTNGASITASSSCASFGSCAVISGSCRVTSFNVDLQWLATTVVSASFPELTLSKSLEFLGNTLLTTISVPKLTNIVGGLVVDENVVLTTLSTNVLAAVVAADNGIFIGNNAVLTSISFPLLSSIVSATGSALTVSENLLLTSFSAPSLATLQGGLNALNFFDNPVLVSLYLLQLSTVSNSAVLGTTFGATINLNGAFANVNFNALTSATNSASGEVLAGLVDEFEVCALTTVTPLVVQPIAGTTASVNSPGVTLLLDSFTTKLTCCGIVQQLFPVEREALLAGGVSDAEASGVSVTFSLTGGTCRVTSFQVDLIILSSTISTVDFSYATTAKGLSFLNNAALTQISFPVLTTLSGGTDALVIDDNDNLLTISFPLLSSVSGLDHGILISDNSDLVSFSFPALTSLIGSSGSALTISTNALLSSFSFSALASLTGGLNALNVFNNADLNSFSFPALATAANNALTGFSFGSTINLELNPSASVIQFPILTSATNSASGGSFGGDVSGSLEACSLITISAPAPSITGTGSVRIYSAAVLAQFTSWAGLQESCTPGIQLTFTPSSRTESLVCVTGEFSASEAFIFPFDNGAATFTFSSGLFSVTGVPAAITITPGTMNLDFASCTITGAFTVSCTLSTPASTLTLYTGCHTFTLPTGFEYAQGFTTGAITISAKKRLGPGSGGNWVLDFDTTE